MTTDRAAMLLPQPFRSALMSEYGRKAPPEEVRLRAGQAATVFINGAELALTGCRPVTSRDIESVIELATGASAHTAADSIRRGFVTAQGGIRLGLCGSGIVGKNGLDSLKQLSSVAIRLPSERKGCAGALLPRLMEGGFISTLIISPPGGGKTTLLRELVRSLSKEGMRISLADERGEVAAARDGMPQLDVGPRTDVMTGVGKAQAVMMLLRSMAPQLIALDEITDPEDVAAMSTAANCGVLLLATAHADGIADLSARPLYRRLKQEKIFSRAVVINAREGERKYTIEELV